jgi:hypothetical protein
VEALARWADIPILVRIMGAPTALRITVLLLTRTLERMIVRWAAALQALDGSMVRIRCHGHVTGIS